jgi:hypothetical protein
MTIDDPIQGREEGHTMTTETTLPRSMPIETDRRPHECDNPAHRHMLRAIEVQARYAHAMTRAFRCLRAENHALRAALQQHTPTALAEIDQAPEVEL